VTLVRRVAAFMARHEMVRCGEVIAVAVSGGLDSVVLLHVLCALRERFGVRLVVATVNHGLRETAAEDARFVRDLASSLGLPVYAGSVLVPAGRGVEEAARGERLAYLAGVPADRVALGHHADDQAETVLLRILRGAGVSGLTAMSPIRGIFIRPLLGEERATIRNWALAQGLRWHEDPTNHLPSFERNRVRRTALPALEDIHGGAAHRLAGMAEVLAEDASYLDACEESAWEACFDGANLSRAEVRRLPRALRLRIVRRFISRMRGVSVAPSWPHVVAGEHLLTSGPADGHVALTEGWRLAVSEDAVWCLPQPPQRVEIGCGGIFAWGIYRLTVGSVTAPGFSVRPPGKGERTRGRPLRELLREWHVPSELRTYHPVFVRDQTIVWVPPRPPVCNSDGDGLSVWIEPDRFGGCPGLPWQAAL